MSRALVRVRRPHGSPVCQSRAPSRMPVSARCPVARRNSRKAGVPSVSGENDGGSGSKKSRRATMHDGCGSAVSPFSSRHTPASRPAAGIAPVTTSSQSSRTGNESTSSVHTWETPAASAVGSERVEVVRVLAAADEVGAG